jgi:hypothetical protein
VKIQVGILEALRQAETFIALERNLRKTMLRVASSKGAGMSEYPRIWSREKELCIISQTLTSWIVENMPEHWSEADKAPLIRDIELLRTNPKAACQGWTFNDLTRRCYIYLVNKKHPNAEPTHWKEWFFSEAERDDWIISRRAHDIARHVETNATPQQLREIAKIVGWKE